MMTEQQLTQWMDTYGTGIFRLCYLCLKDDHLAQDAAVVDTMGCTTKNQVHIVYLVFLVRIRGLEPPPSCPD